MQSYVNLKVSQRNVFGITLEISKDNQSMITEAMVRIFRLLKKYLAQILLEQMPTN